MQCKVLCVVQLVRKWGWNYEDKSERKEKTKERGSLVGRVKWSLCPGWRIEVKDRDEAWCVKEERRCPRWHRRSLNHGDRGHEYILADAVYLWLISLLRASLLLLACIRGRKEKIFPLDSSSRFYLQAKCFSSPLTLAETLNSPWP